MSQGYPYYVEDMTSLCPDGGGNWGGLKWMQGPNEKLLGTFVSLDVTAIDAPCVSALDDGNAVNDGVRIAVVVDHSFVAGSRDLTIPFGETRQVDVWIPFVPSANLDTYEQPLPRGVALERDLRVTVASTSLLCSGTIDRAQAVFYTTTA